MIYVYLFLALFFAGGILEGMLDAERERRTVRPLTPDEEAAWGRYRIEDAAKVARMRATRERDQMRWLFVGLPAAYAELDSRRAA
jgi:hypothetical protein